MKLIDLNRTQRAELAKKIGSSEPYIYQLAIGLRKGSARFMKKINKADPRFKLSDLRPDIWGES